MKGCVELYMNIGGLKVTQNFIIILAGMNQKVILGRDFLFQNGVRLYFDLRKLRMKNTYVDLDEYIHLASPDEIRTPN